MKLSNKTYDNLKWIALVLLPAVQVLWLTLGKIWSFPYLIEIGATIAAVDVFLGSLLGLSNIKYNQLEDGVQDTFNDDSFTEMMGVEEDEDENGSAEE